MADLKVQAMHVMLRLPLLSGALLLAGTSFAVAESPMPDPVAPAVIGRPLDHAMPARPVPQKPATAKPFRPKHAAARPGATTKAAATKVVRPPSRSPQATLAPGLAQDAPATQRIAKQAVDDRADPYTRLDEVGKGTHFARKPLGPGAYFGDRHRTAVRKYYQEHPMSGATANWQIGQPVPGGASLTAVPKGLLASLPAVPPGHRYIQLGGEVVLIAAGSKMVVDGIRRSPR
jgi:hypothetical protein